MAQEIYSMRTGTHAGIWLKVDEGFFDPVTPTVLLCA